ncbi:unnamed protein product [Blepharisma stoltei]|uniref:GAF domain-containing protein n=1 Tax=Blepharisma stoltei TaxID=1481888 RepID=A0AAU9IUS5_9CILI|nr:unnamed protein product [Blepharisma stoltei]
MMEVKKAFVKRLILPDQSRFFEKNAESQYFPKFPTKALKSRNSSIIKSPERSKSVKPKREILISKSRDKLIPDSSSILESISDTSIPLAFRRFHEDNSLSLGKPDYFLIKHREVLLSLLQIPKIAENIDKILLQKLKDLTVIPDKLAIMIKSLLTENPRNYTENVFKIMNDEIKENEQEISGLRESLVKVNKEKKELAEMLISIETQQSLNKDINKCLSRISLSPRASPGHSKSKSPGKATKMEFERIIENAAMSQDIDSGLKLISEEIRIAMQADSVLILEPNAQKTQFEGLLNGKLIKIPSRGTALNMVFLYGLYKSAREIDEDFDQNLPVIVGMKIRAYHIGAIKDHDGIPIALLLVTRKRPELLYEKEIQSLLCVLSLFLTKFSAIKETKRKESIIRAVFESFYELLKMSSVDEFASVIEKYLPRIMSTNRANVLLCDHKLNKLYRRFSSESIEYYPSQKGLAGFCANFKKVLVCNNVSNESRFLKQIDDPDGESVQNILTMPVYKEEMKGLADLTLQVIDKEKQEDFNESDVELLKNYGKVISKAVDAMKTQRHIITVQSMLKNLESTISDLAVDSDTRAAGYFNIQQTIATFNSMFNNK